MNNLLGYYIITIILSGLYVVVSMTLDLLDKMI